MYCKNFFLKIIDFKVFFAKIIGGYLWQLKFVCQKQN